MTHFLSHSTDSFSGYSIWVGICGLSEFAEHQSRPLWFSVSYGKQVLSLWMWLYMWFVPFVLHLSVPFLYSVHLMFLILYVIESLFSGTIRCFVCLVMISVSLDSDNFLLWLHWKYSCAFYLSFLSCFYS